MKKILFPIIALAAFFLFFLWLFSTRETTMDINLFGAGYVTSLLAIYLTILSIGNPDYHKMWWSIPEDMTARHIIDNIFLFINLYDWVGIMFIVYSAVYC